MVRYQDPPGAEKHLRLEPGKRETAIEHAELLKGFSGVKAIVLHLRGKTGEHPHLHVWWESDISGGVTNQTVKNHLKAYNAAFGSYSGQQMWSMRNHNSYETWCNYVLKNGSHQVLLGSPELLAQSVEAKQLIAAEPLSPETPVRIIKKPTAEERLIRYCETELQWKRGAHFTVSDLMSQIVDKSRRAVIEYSNARVHNNQLLAMTRNVMYVFGDDDVKETIKADLGKNFAYI